jgi:hypothetical protein
MPQRNHRKTSLIWQMYDSGFVHSVTMSFCHFNSLATLLLQVDAVYPEESLTAIIDGPKTTSEVLNILDLTNATDCQLGVGSPVHSIIVPKSGDLPALANAVADTLSKSGHAFQGCAFNGDAKEAFGMVGLLHMLYQCMMLTCTLTWILNEDNMLCCSHS